DLPVKKAKIRIHQRAFLYFHITIGSRTFVKERGANDIWQGLVDFPLEELPSPDAVRMESSLLFTELKACEPCISYDPVWKYQQMLTHQKIFSNFVQVRIAEELENQVLSWGYEKGYFPVTDKQLEKLGKPKPIVRYLKDQN